MTTARAGFSVLKRLSSRVFHTRNTWQYLMLLSCVVGAFETYVFQWCRQWIPQESYRWNVSLRVVVSMLFISIHSSFHITFWWQDRITRRRLKTLDLQHWWNKFMLWSTWHANTCYLYPQPQCIWAEASTGAYLRIQLLLLIVIKLAASYFTFLCATVVHRITTDTTEHLYTDIFTH